MKKKLLVTGATGFLGSHFVEGIDARAYQVHPFSQHTMDLTDFKSVQKAVAGVTPDVIVHLGGLVDLTRNFDVAAKCIDVNISGTLHVLEAIREHAPKLFIYISTEEVYGNAPIPYKEDVTLLHPPSPYAMTKVAGEQLCGMYGRYLGFPVIILRVGTMYGPNDSGKRFIPGIIRNALRGADILLNSGNKLRDYVFVKDVVDALIRCLDIREKKDVMEINIGGGKSFTLRFLVEKIVELCQSTSSIRYGAFPDRQLEADVWKMEIKKAKRILGWEPKTSLEDGLSQTIEYYKTHG